MAELNGTWELESGENLEAYFKALGYNTVMCKAADKAPGKGQLITLAVTDDDVKVNEQFYVKKTEYTIKFGEETAGEMDGCKGKGTLNKVNDSEVSGVFTIEAGTEVNSCFKVVDGKLVKTDTVGDVTATRTFVKKE